MPGVVWVFEVKHSQKALHEKALKMGAIPTTKYKVDHLMYRPTRKESGIQPVSLLHHSRFPMSTFSIGPRIDGKQSVCISDRGFDLIMPKLKVGLTPDHAGFFEVNGQEYTLNDFFIRVGVASMAHTTTKGTVVEIEFHPSAIVTNVLPLLLSFAQQFLDDNIKRSAAYFKQQKRSTNFGAQDILAQYLDVFTEMRRRSTVTGLSAF
uniref:Mediator of RNA polymerase II transcription subunit 20 n=1 Tax=Panagrellus redivivus TaxID=6233 RepID=A0A7E4US75_PANRE